MLFIIGTDYKDNYVSGQKRKKLRISISPDYAVLKGLYCSHLSVVCCPEAKQGLKKTAADSIDTKEFP